MSNKESILLQSIESSLSAMMILSPCSDSRGDIVDFVFEIVNKRAEEITGRPKSFFLGNRLLEIMPGNASDGLFSQYKSVIQNQSTLELQHLYQHDGINTWFHISASYSEGKLLVSFLDISSEKKAAMEYERIFNGTQDIIVLVEVRDNNEFFYVRANDLYYAKMNLSPSNFNGKSPQEVFGEKSEQIIKNLKHVVENGPLSISESYSHGKDSLEYITTITPIKEKGRVTHIVTTSRDVTDQKKTQEELSNYRKDLEKSNLLLKQSLRETQEAIQAKSEFLANMSHEVRTPLNGVLGMTDLLKDSELTEEQKNYVSIIQSSGQILLRVINDILDFSKMEAGRLRLEPQKFQVKDLIESSINIFKERAKKKNILLDSYISNEIPLAIYGDQGRLLQIIINLLGNAIKFTEAGSITTKVDVFQIDKIGNIELIFRIIDTGIGIEPNKVKYLFKPFSQIDSSLTRKYEGTGLGLSICDRLVKLMDGRIGFKPNPKGGSEFWFTAKLQPSSQYEVDINQFKMTSLAGAKESNPNQTKILIVEDNSVNQKVARSILRKIGHDAELAVNGREAIDLWKENHFDLILMDIQMPIMDGIAATREIRSIEMKESMKPTVIVAMTAHVSDEDRTICLEAGMNDYITKPIERPTLESIILKWT